MESRFAGHAVRRFLDFHILDLGEGRCTMSIELKPEFDNTTGAIHGGILAMLADTAVACAIARNTCGEMRVNCATSNLNIHFLRRANTAVTATATITKKGSRVCVGSVELHDDAGGQVATATCDFVLLGSNA